LAFVELRNISKTYGRFQAVNDVSLEISDGEFVVFVGPSGCGKSTLLRMIAGLEEITGGELLIGGSPMNKVAAADRGIAMVFQSYALYPHMTVAENMGFALKMTGVPKPEIEAKVSAAAEVLHLQDLLARKPGQLSGGQRQRVAIGRAITRNPDVFLFDEPLSNLDADLRAQMRVEIAKLHKRLGTTMIYVTHDQVEAMTLADRIVLLNDGRIEQQGAPLDLYERPANRFVAGFLGQPKMNFMPASVSAAGRGGLTIALNRHTLLTADIDLPGLAAGTAVEIGVRPNAISIADDGNIAGSVELVERLGSSSLLHIRVDGLDRLVTVETPSNTTIPAGAAVRFRFDRGAVHVFAAQGALLGRI